MTAVAWLATICAIWVLAFIPIARRAMKWVSAFLGRPPSFVYAATYFLCIPLFAAVYNQFPNDFFHSTVRYEAALSQDASSILADLQSEVALECRRLHGTTVVENNGWELDVARLRLEGLHYNDKNIRFTAC